MNDAHAYEMQVQMWKPNTWGVTHHTGSQDELHLVEQKDPEVPAPEAEEPSEELLECVDHQLSSFKRGKPQSILSLLLYKSN
jgi:hypothetical protein